MKNIYKNLALGLFLTVFAAFAAPTFAQDVCADIAANTALYNKYIANYDKGTEQQKIAVEAGKEYIQKYEGCTTTSKDATGAETKTQTFADQVKYFKESVPVLEEGIAKAIKAEEDRKLYGRFIAAYGAKPVSVGEIIESGKAILNKYPDDKDALDISIVIASAAFDELNAKPTAAAYNADLITYGKKAIELIESGKTSKSYGYAKNGNNYTLTNKNKALGVLNYSIGLAMLSDAATKKDAATYFYKSSQYDSPFKNIPLLYRAIGANYLDEFIKIDAERKKIIAGNEGKDNEASLALEAMQKGYADRAVEAYARAYKIAKADPKQKETADAVSTTLKDFYAFRYDGKPLDNLDTYVTTVTSKPLTDPKATITPVKEDEAPATTTPTSGTTTTPTTTPATTKPATTTPAKPVSPATTTEASTTATTAKPKAKKPAPKKKGTR